MERRALSNPTSDPGDSGAGASDESGFESGSESEPEAVASAAGRASLPGRVRDGRERVEQQLESTRQRLESSRSTSWLVDTLFRAFERDVASGGGVLAAAVAFRIFLFIVPFVFFAVTLFGYISDFTDGNPNALAHGVGIGGLIAQSIKGVGNLSGWQRFWTLAVSGFALFLGSRAAVKVLRITHGLIWRVPIPKPRNTTRAAGAFIGLVGVAMLTTALVGWLRSESLVLGILAVIVWAAVPFGLWLLVAWWMPRADCPWWALIPGSVWCAAGALVLHLATITWFTYEIQAKSDTYGVIGVSIALLLWAYLLGRIITASASINAAYWYRNEERQGREVPPELDIETRLSLGAVEAEPNS
jgi:uncharacterized BrkB/YihY/UPF0761 family membrane protein